jgi:hypothetical protein
VIFVLHNQEYLLLSHGENITLDFFFLAHEEVKAQKKRNYEITRTVLGMEAFEMLAQRIL